MVPGQRGDDLSVVQRATAAQFTGDANVDEIAAWEEVDTGRFMPRRIKGSCKGRALG